MTKIKTTRRLRQHHSTHSRNLTISVAQTSLRDMSVGIRLPSPSHVVQRKHGGTKNDSAGRLDGLDGLDLAAAPTLHVTHPHQYRDPLASSQHASLRVPALRRSSGPPIWKFRCLATLVDKSTFPTSATVCWRPPLPKTVPAQRLIVCTAKDRWLHRDSCWQHGNLQLFKSSLA